MTGNVLPPKTAGPSGAGYGKPVMEQELGEKPFQFSLRALVLTMLGMSFLFAILFQWGWVGFAVCWLLAVIGSMCYGAYWGRWEWLAGGMLMLLLSACIPVHSGHGPASRRSSCQNNLRQIGIALQNYHDTYKSFPPAYIADASGRPMHSWRVLLLPFLEQQNLYDQYRFDEPWDGPNNRLLAAEIPYIFRCPSEANSFETETSYLAVVGPETIWPGDKAVSFDKIRDGTSNTLIVVESHDSGIHWMEPRDLHTLQMPMAVNPLHGQGICSCHGAKKGTDRGDCAQFVRADGSVGLLENDTPPATVRALLSIDGGEQIELP
jgi:hypothetical protein